MSRIFWDDGRRGLTFLLLLPLLLVAGCVSKRKALKYADEMYQVGELVGKMAYKLELAKSKAEAAYLKDELEKCERGR